MAGELISIAEARARILDGMQAAGTEVVALADTWGRVIARPALARLTLPPTDASAMDGFAVRGADCAKDAVLRVVGSAPAGHPWGGTLGAGECLRIFTGSVMPAGADTVLIQENATDHGATVTVNEPVAAGRHVRRAGQDFAAGDELLAAGQRLNARHIGLLAAGNHPWVEVFRRPRVGILATGDEIALPGEPIPPGGLVSSNSHALAALARANGAEPVVLPVVGDDLEALARAGSLCRGLDMLVTTGGASVGAHDLVAEGLGRSGLVLNFAKVAMRPGKPVMYGRIGDVPMLGLPGNPVSALVTAVVFLLPAIARLAGLPGDPAPTARALLGAPLRANDSRVDHLRATLDVREDGTLVATAFERQDSAMLTVLCRADAFLVRPPHAPAAEPGAEVEVIRLDALGL